MAITKEELWRRGVGSVATVAASHCVACNETGPLFEAIEKYVHAMGFLSGIPGGDTVIKALALAVLNEHREECKTLFMLSSSGKVSSHYFSGELETALVESAMSL